jgi:acetyl-CoA synthetase
MSDEALSNLLHEDRRFPPSEEFAAQANVKADTYAEADADRLAFWEAAARRLDWATPWHTVLDWTNPPFAKWFVGGTLNAASPETPARSPTRTCSPRSAGRRTRWWSWA